MLWPPTYKIKKHHLAKNVRLRISPTKILEIVVPKRFNIKYIPTILAENKQWILKELNATPSIDFNLPDELELRALNETWKINYFFSKCRLKLLTRTDREIVLLGDIHNKTRCKIMLTDWLKDYANLKLIAFGKQIASTTALDFKDFKLRDYNSRWGSCDHQKIITLSYKLIFLPPELARHVIIHELCHTIHMNHSASFWNLVAKYDIHCAANRIALRSANDFVPMILNIQ